MIMILSEHQRRQLINKTFRTKKGRRVLAQSLINPIFNLLDNIYPIEQVPHQADRVLILRTFISGIKRLQGYDTRRNEQHLKIIADALNKKYSYPCTINQLLSLIHI